MMFRDTQRGYIILFLLTTADIGVGKDEVRMKGEDNTFGEKKLEVSREVLGDEKGQLGCASRDFMVILPVDNSQGRDILGRRDLTLFDTKPFLISRLRIAAEPRTVYMNAPVESKFDLRQFRLDLCYCWLFTAERRGFFASFK